ncbi:unnamed protein product, partial [Soboliphyme baturini]|uniref:Polyprotein n=1 Tax=Soboliphyme baturini TaxID=241478 RepID=A0A183J6P2_9BILA
GSRNRSHSATGVSSRRRVSRAFEVRPSVKSNKPLYVWMQEHMSKQTIGLILNFLVLLTLLAMLITIVSHFKTGSDSAADCYLVHTSSSSHTLVCPAAGTREAGSDCRLSSACLSSRIACVAVVSWGEDRGGIVFDGVYVTRDKWLFRRRLRNGPEPFFFTGLAIGNVT